eukprot:gene24387-32834_t
MLCTVRSAVDGTLPDLIQLKLKEMGKVIRLNLPQMSYYVVIGDTTLARQVFEEEIEKPSSAKRLTLNNTSIFSKKTIGENWEMNRKGVASSFSFSNLSKSIPCLNQKIDELMDILEHNSQQETIFEITKLMLSFTMDFISTAMFGVDLHSMKEDEHSEGQEILREMDIAIKEIALKQRFNPIRSWMFWSSEVQRGDAAARYLMAAQQRILEKYRASNSPEDIAKDSSILAHLVRCPYPSDGERCADMLTHMVAGHDTTAYSLSWIMVEVARHPEVQQRIQQEIRAVVSDDEQYLLPSHLSQLTYLECVIKEGMRLWPVAALGSIRLASKDIPYNDYIIPKGSYLMIPFYPLFRTADIQDPESFLPDRWAEDAPEAEKQRLKDISFPFALGKRNCVGQNLAKLELKLVLASMLRSYRFELQSEVSKDYFLTMKPVNAIFRVYKL